MTTLRRWQTEALTVYRRWRTQPTAEPSIIRAIMGAGKTVLTREIVGLETRVIEARSINACVLVVVPTQRLVVQTVATLEAGGLRPAQYWAESKTIGTLTVTTYASLASVAERLTRPVSLMVLDECHETETAAIAETVSKINPRYLLGLTATPWRSDEEESLSLFRGCLYDYGPSAALADGVVVPWEIVTPEVEGNLDEWCAAQIRTLPKPCLATAENIEDAEKFAAWLAQQGVGARAIHSKQKDPGAVLSAWAAGEFGTLVHVDMLTRGVDVPHIRSLVLRIPISSRTKFPQLVGRGLRAAPGKEKLIIADPHCLFAELGIDYEACLGGTPPKATKKALPDLTEADFADLINSDERDQALADVVKAMRKDKTLRLPRLTKVLVMALANAWRMAGAIEMRTQLGSWRRADATDAQKRAVAKMGFLTHGAGPADSAVLLRRACVDGAEGLFSRGVTSDLFSVLRVVSEHKRVWP